jgi:predicted CoA-binding protein
MLQMKTVAIVGLSDKPHRESHEVANFLQHRGYRIVPVNPMLAGRTILGEPCHASLTEAAKALATIGLAIDWVDIFRKAEDVPPVVDEAVSVAAKGVWLQLGIRCDQAIERACAAGLFAVQDRCSKIELMRR